MPKRLSGPTDRYVQKGGTGQQVDDSTPPHALFNLFDAGEKARLFSNVAEAMQGVPKAIAERQCKLFDQVHLDYGKGVRAALAAKAASAQAE